MTNNLAYFVLMLEAHLPGISSNARAEMRGDRGRGYRGKPVSDLLIPAQGFSL